MRKLLPILLLTACPEAEPEEQWEEVSYVDEGLVCWEAGGGSIAIQVVLQNCMSSSCTRAFTSSCEAFLDGSTLELTSDIRWENHVNADGCTTDCGIPMAECELSGVADGTYALDFDGASYTIDVPGSSSPTGCD